MPELNVLLLGDAGRDEFSLPAAVPDAWAAVRRFNDSRTAAAAVAAGRIVPDVIVVAQSFPGQFSHDELETLRRLAPVARIVGLMGSWCEGEMRSGHPWPGVVRTYWHQWPARAERQFRRMIEGHACSWTLPPTAAEEERLLVDASERWPQRNGRVVLCTASQQMAEFLSAACRSRGFVPLWQRTAPDTPIKNAAAAVFDVANLAESEWNAISRLSAALRPAPVIALLPFPRSDDDRQARSAGAAAVLSKPLALDDLYWELDRIAGS